MRSADYWITMANTPFDSRRLGVDCLPYPLVLPVPHKGLSHDGFVTVSTKTRHFSIGIELLVMVEQAIPCDWPAALTPACTSLHLAASITNTYHLEAMNNRLAGLSDRDWMGAEYFTRWWDRSTAIIGRLDADWSSLLGKTIGILSANLSEKHSLEYYHSPHEILLFLSGFAPLPTGTHVAMGRLFEIDLNISQAPELSVTVCLEGLGEHQVGFCLED